MNDILPSNLPSFLCIGAQKAATSWLWVMLRQHPAIWMPPLKEIHFFDHVHIPENRSWTLPHIKKGVTEALKWHVENEAINLDHFKYLVDLAMVEPFTEDWYRACYHRPAAEGKSLGDITPEYSTLPEHGVEHVKKLLGSNLKLIYIIRNPVDRALSQLKMNLTRRGQEGSGEDFWIQSAKEPVIAQRGDYRTYVPRWEKVFPSNNILYIPYKQVKADPVTLLRQIEDHLGIPYHHGYSDLEKRVHKTREAKVPTTVIRYLEQSLTHQSDFIKERFGEKFYSLT